MTTLKPYVGDDIRVNTFYCDTAKPSQETGDPIGRSRLGVYMTREEARLHEEMMAAIGTPDFMAANAAWMTEVVKRPQGAGRLLSLNDFIALAEAGDDEQMRINVTSLFRSLLRSMRTGTKLQVFRSHCGTSLVAGLCRCASSEHSLLYAEAGQTPAMLIGENSLRELASGDGIYHVRNIGPVKRALLQRIMTAHQEN